VGQSETAVAHLVDCFVMLLQPGAGDDLQGIKRGILELVDMVVVTKADGPNAALATQAQHHYRQALHILRQGSWHPPVLAVSGIEKTGLAEVWQSVEDYMKQADTNAKRCRQSLHWLDSALDEALRAWFSHRSDQKLLERLRLNVEAGKVSVPEAVAQLIKQLS
jgi:LAO/AO transport system kinase